MNRALEVYTCRALLQNMGTGQHVRVKRDLADDTKTGTEYAVASDDHALLKIVVEEHQIVFIKAELRVR